MIKTKSYELKGHKRRAEYRMGRIAKDSPHLFCQWQVGLKSATGQ